MLPLKLMSDWGASCKISKDMEYLIYQMRQFDIDKSIEALKKLLGKHKTIICNECSSIDGSF